ncbi:hypothetical protein HPB50_025547 [Hyalomma asiaticum]|uniref:Uncharacterized protein n=1 Tax=Hyalomma asiaticum TaxID=266040 RepID=A0ACB7RQN4_HYAAI|nr:hypothetical protein HPB50_025547 [Hyalomma asiaticum]
MAAGFRSHGIGSGDRVLVHVENSIDSFVAACSIPMTGATLVTSDVTFNEGGTFQLATPHDVCIGGGNISFYVCFTYVFFVISIGATIVLLDNYSTMTDVFAAFRDHKANVVHATPTKLLEIVHEAKKAGQCFPLVKKFTSLGTPMTKVTKSAIVAAFSPSELRSCYGMTEVSGYLTAPPSGEITAGDVGFPVSGTRMKVVDPISGAVLSHNQRGEVLFHTRHIMVGYYKNPAETASFTTDDGWIRTGKDCEYQSLALFVA